MDLSHLSWYEIVARSNYYSCLYNILSDPTTTTYGDNDPEDPFRDAHIIPPSLAKARFQFLKEYVDWTFREPELTNVLKGMVTFYLDGTLLVDGERVMMWRFPYGVVPVKYGYQPWEYYFPPELRVKVRTPV